MSGHFDKLCHTVPPNEELTQFFRDAPKTDTDVIAYFSAERRRAEYLKIIEDKVPADTPNVEDGKKFDGGKPDYTLLPFKAIEDVVKVLGFGAVKYGRNNWQKVERQRYIAAAFRHLVAIAKGEEFDEESGMPHAAHLSCCSLFLSELGSS